MYRIAPADFKRVAVAFDLLDYEIKRNRAVVMRDFKSSEAVEPAPRLAEHRIGERIVRAERAAGAATHRERESTSLVCDLRPEVAQVEPLARARFLALEEQESVFGLDLHRLRGKRSAHRKERNHARSEFGC